MRLLDALDSYMLNELSKTLDPSHLIHFAVAPWKSVKTQE